MASLTLKNLPADLLNRLRKAAEADRRSLTQEAIALIESALGRRRERTEGMRNDVDSQVAAWRKLAGKWKSDTESGVESEQISRARTGGREVEL